MEWIICNAVIDTRQQIDHFECHRATKTFESVTELKRDQSNSLFNIRDVKDKAHAISNASFDGTFWSTSEKVVPSFNVITAVITFKKAILCLF